MGHVVFINIILIVNLMISNATHEKKESRYLNIEMPPQQVTTVESTVAEKQEPVQFVQKDPSEQITYLQVLQQPIEKSVASVENNQQRFVFKQNNFQDINHQKGFLGKINVQESQELPQYQSKPTYQRPAMQQQNSINNHRQRLPQREKYTETDQGEQEKAVQESNDNEQEVETPNVTPETSLEANVEQEVSNETVSEKEDETAQNETEKLWRFELDMPKVVENIKKYTGFTLKSLGTNNNEHDKNIGRQGQPSSNDILNEKLKLEVKPVGFDSILNSIKAFMHMYRRISIDPDVMLVDYVEAGPGAIKTDPVTYPPRYQEGKLLYLLKLKEARDLVKNYKHVSKLKLTK